MKGGYLKGGREEWRWNKRREREGTRDGKCKCERRKISWRLARDDGDEEHGRP